MFTSLKIRSQAEKLVGNLTQFLIGVGPTQGNARYTLYSDGRLELYTSGVPTSTTIWTHWYLRGTTTGIGADYEIRFTLQSGSITSSLVDGTTWWSLSSDRTLSKTGIGAATILVEVRRAGQSTVVASGSVKLDVSSTQ